MNIGDRYGRLLLISVVRRVVSEGRIKRRRKFWLCKCDCGIEKIIRQNSLTCGESKSCGCLQKETRLQNMANSPRLPKYGDAIKRDAKIKRTYCSWALMKDRCLNKNNVHFNSYGGRGISVCDRWQSSFKDFLDDMGYRPEGLSIGRIDNNKDYEPGNCRWETSAQQMDNTRRTVKIKFPDRDEEETLTEGCRRLGLDRNSIYQRLKNGWSLNDAIYKPIKRYKNTTP